MKTKMLYCIFLSNQMNVEFCSTKWFSSCYKIKFILISWIQMPLHLENSSWSHKWNLNGENEIIGLPFFNHHSFISHVIWMLQLINEYVWPFNFCHSNHLRIDINAAFNLMLHYLSLLVYFWVCRFLINFVVNNKIPLMQKIRMMFTIHWKQTCENSIITNHNELTDIPCTRV